MRPAMTDAAKLATATRTAPDYASRAYWAGTIKMSLSKFFTRPAKLAVRCSPDEYVRG